MPYSKILLSSQSAGIANGLTYESANLDVGTMVQVPLRKQVSEGIVVSSSDHTGDFDVKSIKERLGETPLLFPHLIQTAEWIAHYYHCTLRDAFRPFLPAKKWSDLLPQQQEFVRLLDPDLRVKGKRQQECVDYLREEEWVSLDSVRSAIGTSLLTIRALEKQGVLTIEQQQGLLASVPSLPPVRPTLNTDQEAAYVLIQKSPVPSLLFGVTGSGKTEVYAQLIADAVEQGKKCILLVPEILLTEHCIARFQMLLSPERIGIVHSRLTSSERKKLWRKCHAGEVDLVIGSRSALFSPLERLGLVILDEEHEWTYKNEQTPRYHARDTAEALCRFSGAKLVLGSATPCVESWVHAQEGIYTLVELPKRYGEQSLPDVTVVDLANVAFDDAYPFSKTLHDMIDETLKAGQQTVLFLNRRGHASSLLCLDCRRRIVSPDSLLPYTVHTNAQGMQRLVDHTSNRTVDVPTHCPHCASVRLLAVGAGTQKVEKVLEKMFPNARLLRADSDTLTHPEQMRLLLKKMREEQADILLGTQSVVKGLDLPNVTLAAVLVADVGLSLPHFRAGERVFQVLTQLTGRSGRMKPGRVVLQTFRPNCPEVQCAAQHKTREFLDTESQLRRKMLYPPATKMFRLLFRGLHARTRAGDVAIAMQNKDASSVVQHGPTLFGGGKIWQVIVRGSDPIHLLKEIDLHGAIVDVDPFDCL